MSSSQQPSSLPHPDARERFRHEKLRFANEMRDRFTNPQSPRLHREDRATIAQNLGKLIESYWPGQRSHRTKQIFEAAFGPESASSQLKKRKRYVRFEDELASSSVIDNEEYCSSPSHYLRLMDGVMSVLEASEEKRKLAILELLQETTFDTRPRKMKIHEDHLSSLYTFLRNMHSVVMNCASIGRLFDVAGDYPLSPSFESTKNNLQSVNGSLWRSLETESSDNKSIPDTCHLRIDRGIPLLEAIEAGSDDYVDDLHWSIPRIKIGTIYLPVVERSIRLDIVYGNLAEMEEAAIGHVLQVAADAILPSPSGARIAVVDSYHLRFNNMQPSDIDLQCHMRWMELSLFMLVAPIKSDERSRIYFLSHYEGDVVDSVGDFPTHEHFEIRGLPEFGSYIAMNGEYRLIIEDQPPEPFSYEFFQRLICEDSELWEPFMFGDGVRVIGQREDRIEVDHVRRGRVRALIRTDFIHEDDEYTPFPHASLAGALARNETYAPEAERLSRRLAEDGLQLVRLVDKFRKEGDAAYRRAVKART